MHELSIAQSVIQIVEKSLPSKFEKQVTTIHLQIGKLSGIEIDALEFAFNILKEKTKIALSQLTIEIVDGEGLCNSCNNIFPLLKYGQSCPFCESFDITIIKGKEMKVTRIEAE